MRPLRILLVEDSAEDAELVARAFRAAPYAVDLVHARTLAGAAYVAADRLPDLAILDLGLPDSWGARTVVRAREILGERVAILVYSGTLDPEACMTAVAQAQGQIAKGFLRRGALVRATTQALARVLPDKPAAAPTARVACPRTPERAPCALVPLDDVTPEEWDDLISEAQAARERLRRATR